MKKNLSTHSLLNTRSGSLQKLSTDPKQPVDKQQQKPIQKHRIPSPIVKNIKLDTFKEQIKLESKKNDIKEIYEYKIKQRAQKSKISQKQKHNDLSSTQHQNQPSSHMQDKRLIESLKLQNEKMSKQLLNLIKQNKNLLQLLKQSQQNKNSDNKKDKQKNINEKDYKKSILNKLNDRQRIKTQMTASFSKLNHNHQSRQNLHEKQKNSKPKNASSKNKQLQGSRNSITMNLNMSFVKIKSPSTSKNADFRENSKEFMSKMAKSTSGKIINFKDEGSKSTSKISTHQSNPDIRSLFKSYLLKKSITQKDLSEFYLLNKKIFSEFGSLITYSRQVYAEILNKIDLTECYDSKRMQQSKYSKNQNNMKETLRMIQELYKMNSLETSKRDFASPLISEKKYHISEIQHETPESSVNSFSQAPLNIQRNKSYEKYRLKKLNQNLDLFANMQSKKLKTQATQPETTESKVYFSKPISTNVSRKISFNNSCNNSLKNSKIE